MKFVYVIASVFLVASAPNALAGVKDKRVQTSRDTHAASVRAQHPSMPRDHIARTERAESSRTQKSGLSKAAQFSREKHEAKIANSGVGMVYPAYEPRGAQAASSGSVE